MRYMTMQSRGQAGQVGEVARTWGARKATASAFV